MLHLKIDIYDVESKVADFYEKLNLLNLDLHIAIITENHLEITNNNVNKATAIEIFLERYNLKYQRLYDNRGLWKWLWNVKKI